MVLLVTASNSSKEIGSIAGSSSLISAGVSCLSSSKRLFNSSKDIGVSSSKRLSKEIMSSFSFGFSFSSLVGSSTLLSSGVTGLLTSLVSSSFSSLISLVGSSFNKDTILSKSTKVSSSLEKISSLFSSFKGFSLTGSSTLIVGLTNL